MSLKDQQHAGVLYFDAVNGRFVSSPGQVERAFERMSEYHELWAGRSGNSEGLGLAEAGIEFDPDLETTLFAPYAYDCAIVTALAKSPRIGRNSAANVSCNVPSACFASSIWPTVVSANAADPTGEPSGRP